MILGIVQARLGSTRLPEKVLAEIEGYTLIEHVLRRSAAAKRVDKVVVATTNRPEDDRLEKFVRESFGFEVFRGSTDDVLDRFFRCAAPYSPELIVRITADDPLKDPEIIDRAVKIQLDDPTLDYCSNTIKPTFPEGFDIETFRFSALATAASEARLPSEREHVTPFIWKRPGRFRIKNFEHDEDLSRWRLTVDKPADLELMRAIFRALSARGTLFSYRDVITLLKQRPELREINSGTQRNEGYTPHEGNR
jgi:spore coat polysaccharide biosynthesis protein SpsF